MRGKKGGKAIGDIQADLRIEIQMDRLPIIIQLILDNQVFIGTHRLLYQAVKVSNSPTKFQIEYISIPVMPDSSPSLPA